VVECFLACEALDSVPRTVTQESDYAVEGKNLSLHAVP
jgi:hypothetical protein